MCHSQREWYNNFRCVAGQCHDRAITNYRHNVCPDENLELRAGIPRRGGIRRQKEFLLSKELFATWLVSQSSPQLVLCSVLKYGKIFICKQYDLLYYWSSSLLWQSHQAKGDYILWKGDQTPASDAVIRGGYWLCTLVDETWCPGRRLQQIWPQQADQTTLD